MQRQAGKGRCDGPGRHGPGGKAGHHQRSDGIDFVFLKIPGQTIGHNDRRVSISPGDDKRIWLRERNAVEGRQRNFHFRTQLMQHIV